MARTKRAAALKAEANVKQSYENPFGDETSSTPSARQSGAPTPSTGTSMPPPVVASTMARTKRAAALKAEANVKQSYENPFGDKTSSTPSARQSGAPTPSTGTSMPPPATSLRKKLASSATQPTPSTQPTPASTSGSASAGIVRKRKAPEDSPLLSRGSASTTASASVDTSRNRRDSRLASFAFEDDDDVEKVDAVARPPPAKVQKHTGKGKGKAMIEVEDSEEDEEEVVFRGRGKDGVWVPSAQLSDEEYEDEDDGGVKLDEELELMDEFRHDDEDIVDLVEEDEAEDDEAGKNAGPKKPRRKPRPSIPLKHTVDSFKAISVGKAGPLRKISRANELRCFQEGRRRFWFSVHKRHRDFQTDQSELVGTHTMRASWLSETPEQIFDGLWKAMSRERQLVMGGMWLPDIPYEFTDLPLMTDDEFKMWVVYGDQVHNDFMYGGSGTADPDNGASGQRLFGYERTARWFEMDESVEPERQNSAHLRCAFQAGKPLNMELRVIAVFDPLKTEAVTVLRAEAIIIDVLQCYNRAYTGHNPGHTPQALQASIDAVEEQDGKWIGLNHASPNLQGVRASSLKHRIARAMDWTCGVCGLEDHEKDIDLWRFKHNANSLHLEISDDLICSRCLQCLYMNKKHLGVTLSIEELREKRSDRYTSDLKRNAISLRKRGMPNDDWLEGLARQDFECPLCHNGPAEEARHDLLNFKWSPNPFDTHFKDCVALCTPCRAEWKRRKGGMTEAEFVQHRSDYVASRATGEMIPDTVDGAKAAAAKHWSKTKTDRHALMLEQERRCAICDGNPETWNAAEKWTDLGNKQIRLLNVPATGQEPARSVATCLPCYTAFNTRRKKPNPDNAFADCVTKRRKT
ncbi:unnamed protein product [Zymoseptoria tritici ST99CH_3D1]|nr:unnamed protein product [Zymoseptoria tritici ST99CH_3D1]